MRVTGAEGPGEAHRGIDGIFCQCQQLRVLALVLLQSVFVYQVLILGSREGQGVRTRSPKWSWILSSLGPFSPPKVPN